MCFGFSLMETLVTDSFVFIQFIKFVNSTVDYYSNILPFLVSNILMVMYRSWKLDSSKRFEISVKNEFLIEFEG